MSRAGSAPGASRTRRLLACPAHARTYAALIGLELALGIAWAVDGGVAPGPALALWLGGVALWTLLEYLLHRFAFHLEPAHPLSVLGARQHHAHHAAASRTPITKPLRLTLPVLALGWGVAAWSFGAQVTPLWAGLIAGYLAYELLHVAAHVLAADEHPAPAIRRAHLGHHVDVGRNFGITSPLWDVVLGTYARRGARGPS